MRTTDNTQISQSKAFSKLLRIWILGPIPCLFLIAVQMLGPAFKGTELPALFLPLILPVPAFLVVKRVRSGAQVVVSRYRTAKWFSWSYLLALTALPLLLPHYGFVLKDMTGLFQLMTAVHGLAAAVIGNALES